MKHTKRVLSVLLTLIMFTSVIPMGIMTAQAAYASNDKSYCYPIRQIVNTGRGFSSSHKGVDLSIAKGTPVYASCEGTVEIVYTGCKNYNGAANSGGDCNSKGCTSSKVYMNGSGYCAGYYCNNGLGNGVVIKNKDGKFCHYGHMNSVSVKKGDHVTPKTKIGEVGSAGCSTGPHLHFSISSTSSGGTFYNPFLYIFPGFSIKLLNNGSTSVNPKVQIDFPWKDFEASKCTLSFGTSSSSLTQTTSDSSINTFSCYYNLGSKFGSLTKGNTYYFKMTIVKDGTTYNSSVYSFVAGGGDKTFLDYSTVASSVTAPTTSTISMSKFRILVGNSITFTFSSDTATRYNLGIDAQDGTRVFTSGNQIGTTYTYACNTVGLYSAYVTAGNDKGTKDSNRVYFQVVSDTPTMVNSVLANGHIYELYLADLTWENAKAWCENNGGYLATITNQAEQSTLENLLGNHKSGRYWLGAEEIADTYHWVTGETWDYENWSSGEPNHEVSASGETEHCLGTISSPQWNDFTNDAANFSGFIMELGSIDNAPAKVNTMESNGHTYDLYMAKMTWEEAKTWCENNGGHLVTITSAEEQTAFETLLGNHKVGAYWMGGEETTGIYRWVTGEPWDYENWADGEPGRTVYASGEQEQYLGTHFDTQWHDYINSTATICGFVMETDPSTEINDFELSESSFVYNGTVQKPTVIAKDSNGVVLTEGVDYTVAYSDGCKTPGNYNVAVTFMGNYSGEVVKSFSIEKQPIDPSCVTLYATEYAYNGTVQQPAVTVKNALGNVMTQNTSYKISYSADSKYPGSYTVTVTGMGYYTGTATKTYTIAKQPIDASRISLSSASFVYNGTVRQPTVIVKNANEKTMTLNNSYTVTYNYSAESKYPGTYTVTATVTGKGYYNGTVTKTLTYKIEKQPLDASRVTLSKITFTYNGKVQHPTVTVRNMAGNVMTKNKSYTVSYSADSKYPGKYTVTFTGTGYYTGTITKTYTIAKQPIDASRVTLSKTSFTYNGKIQQPTVTVKNVAGNTMTENVSYMVTYSSGCKAKGTYTVMITGKGYYTGTVEKTFTIK